MKPARFLVLAVVSQIIFSVHGHVIPGRWEKVDLQPPGTALKIILKSGDQIEGTLKQIRATDLTLRSPDGSQTRLPKADIRKVESPRKVNDTLKDGVAVGFLVGAIAGGFLLVYPAALSGNWDTATRALVGGAVGGGVGAAIGLAVDHMVKRPAVRYVVLYISK